MRHLYISKDERDAVRKRYSSPTLDIAMVCLSSILLTVYLSVAFAYTTDPRPVTGTQACILAKAKWMDLPIQKWVTRHKGDHYINQLNEQCKAEGLASYIGL